MLAEELIERADHTARKMFEEHGRLPDALVWIYTKGRMIAVPCKPRGPAAEIRAKAVACAIIQATRKNGVFEGVVLVAEAWMSLCPGGRASTVRPAFDPGRIGCCWYLWLWAPLPPEADF
jgi:hypothetical protein